MHISRRARIGAVLMALLVLLIFVLIMIASRPPQTVQHMSDLNAYSVSAPAAPAEITPPDLAVQSPVALREAAAPPDDPGEAGAAADVAPIEVSIPKLAYAYTLGFRLDGNRIAAAQDAHRGLCERMGLARCQLIAMSRGRRYPDPGTAQAARRQRRSAAFLRYADQDGRGRGRSGDPHQHFGRGRLEADRRCRGADPSARVAGGAAHRA